MNCYLISANFVHDNNAAEVFSFLCEYIQFSLSYIQTRLQPL